MRGMSYVIIAGMLGLFLTSPASADPPLSRRHRIDEVVELRDVKADAAGVSGRLVNLTERTLSDLKLSVRDTFLWTNEMPPGSDDPSHAATFMLVQEVPPRGSARFTVRRARALPARSDGQFRTEVEVMGLRQTPAQSAAY